MHGWTITIEVLTHSVVYKNPYLMTFAISNKKVEGTWSKDNFETEHAKSACDNRHVIKRFVYPLPETT